MSVFSERKRRICEYAISCGEERFDPHSSLMWGRARDVHQIRESTWLAQCYFQQGVHLPRANDVIRQVLSAQCVEGERVGNFRWNYEDKRVEDQNCAPFIVPSLAYIYRCHGRDLVCDVRSRLGEALDLAHREVLELEAHIPVWYGNVYLKLISCLVMLGDETAALAWAKRYYRFTQQFGINEYAAWNYAVVQLAGLQNAYWYCAEPCLKDLLAELLEFHWLDLIHQVHFPTLMISSPSARAKGLSGLARNRSLLTLCYLYFGLGSVEIGALPRLELLISDYQPPPEVYELVDKKLTGEPFSYQARYGRVDVTSFQTAEYALATQSGRRNSLGVTNTTKPLLSSEKQEVTVQLLARNPGTYQGVTFRVNDALGDFNRYWVSSLQHRNMAIVSYNFDPQQSPVSEISSRAVLGLTEDIGQVLVNGLPWGGTPQALANGDVLVYRIGGVFIGIRFLTTDVIRITDHPVAARERPIVLERTGDEVVLTSYVAYASEEFPADAADRRLGYLLVICSQQDFPTLNEFCRHLSEIDVDQTLTGSLHEVVVRSGGDTLVLREDLATNTIVTREINELAYSNDCLLCSKYVFYRAGEPLSARRLDLNGGVPYPPQPAVRRGAAIRLDLADAALNATQAGRHSTAGWGGPQSEQRGAPLVCPARFGVGVNIPFFGQWQVELRVELLRAKPQASATLRWNSDSVGHQPYTVPLNLPVGRMQRLITPHHWLHQGTHTLWWETDSACVVHEILVTNGI
jgi:hypothetical protein